MFLATEHPKNRERKIKRLLEDEPSIAVLVAAAHFEWTICRAVLFLSKTPNRALRQKMERVYGLDRYKDFWRDELTVARNTPTLPRIVKNWEDVKTAFLWRNRLIHGRDRCTKNMAEPKVKALLQGAADIRDFCSSLAIDLRRRLPIRKKASS